MPDFSFSKIFKLQTILLFLIVIIVTFGFRLFTLIIDFAYYERMHNYHLMTVRQKIIEGNSKKSDLLYHLHNAISQPEKVLDSLTFVETYFINLLGQKFLLELVKEDILYLSKTIDSLENLNRQILTYNDLIRLSESLEWSFDNTERFGEGLRKTAQLTLNVVIATSVLFLFLYFYIMYTSINILLIGLGRVTDSLLKIENGLLEVKFEESRIREVTQLYSSILNMVDSIEYTIRLSRQTAESVKIKTSEGRALSYKYLSEVEIQKEQAAHLYRSVDEFQSAINSIATAACSASDAVNNTSELIHKGKLSITDAWEAIRKQAECTSLTSKAVHKVKLRTEEISKIITNVSNISDHINLLALNAAIESAHAGIYGRAFSVVADDIRALALQTQRATQEIHENFKKLNTEIKNAESVMSESLDKARLSNERATVVSTIFTEIYDSIDSIVSMNHAIASSTEQQTVFIEEIKSSTSNIVKASNHINVTAEETAALNDQINQVVDQYEVCTSRKYQRG
tara:strand:- start:688 stop:2229 length:1542 start_codon:yes stop_codon:yes gene_type:complete